MKKILLTAAMMLTMISCTELPVSDLGRNSIIPKPQLVEADGDYFVFSSRTKIRIDLNDSVLFRMSEILRNNLDLIQAETEGNESQIIFKPGNSIHFLLSKDSLMDEEGYRISIEKKQLTLSAASKTGMYRAIQTLVQLSELEGSDVIRGDGFIAIPTGIIEDYPMFEYRGSMLDVSRHFFDPEEVKRYIDQMTFYKLNYLHLHLSDDQGWRIEIKSWPRLTEIGGSTEVGGGAGGFYTQEEYAGIVAYAAERFITIVPEIDMPGHTNAALASYAELNCDGIARELYTGTRVGFSTLCTDKELTYTFVDDVVREISSLSPGPYFHIGGDESHVTELPDYIYFVNRVQDIVRSHGKTVIGWDEISHADIGANTVAQYWASAGNARRALDKGARIILSPAKYCYLDMKYDSLTVLGLDWAGYIDVETAYNWKPMDLIEGIKKEQILGIESPLWAETIQTSDDIEQMAFPRLIGHAEIGWSNSDSLSLEDYSLRLKDHEGFLEKRGIDFYRGR